MSEKNESHGPSMGSEEPVVDDGVDIETKRFRDRFVKVMMQSPLALCGLIVTCLVLIVGILAPVLAPYDPSASYDSFVEPMAHSTGGEFHVLGTNAFGQDVLSRIIYGTRISIGIAIAAGAVAVIVGTLLGLISAYYGGLVDDIIMRYIDFQWAFPAIILAIGIIAFIGEVGATNVVIALGIAYITEFARLVRGEVLSIREKEYIMAAEAVGMSDWRIMTREILPNAVAVIIVQLTLMLPLVILGEAGLSFLGVGVNVETPSWGMMLSRGQDFINQAWWLSVLPGIAIVITVVAFNLFGDGLRDAFDVSEQIEEGGTR